MTNIKALLLDLDGTLINSERPFALAFIKVLSEYGIKVTIDDYKKYELDQNCMLLNMLTDKGLLHEEHSSIMKKVYYEYEKSFPNVIKEADVKTNFEMLKSLKDNGYILALVSTSRKVFIDMLIEEYKIDDLFSCIVAREDVANLKPAPNAYLLAMQSLGLKPKECLAIEDAKRGIEAALKAGIITYKVNEYTEKKESYGGIYEYESVRDIFEIFQKNVPCQSTTNDCKIKVIKHN